MFKTKLGGCNQPISKICSARQIRSFRQVGLKIKHIWNHHPESTVTAGNSFHVWEISHPLKLTQIHAKRRSKTAKTLHHKMKSWRKKEIPKFSKVSHVQPFQNASIGRDGIFFPCKKFTPKQHRGMAGRCPGCLKTDLLRPPPQGIQNFKN